MSLRVFVFAVLVGIGALAASGCARPSEEDCTRICWKAAELAFQKQTEDKVAAEPDEAAKEAIREQAKKDWQEIVDMPTNPELMRCVVSCTKDGRPSQVECIDKAKTHAEVDDCM